MRATVIEVTCDYCHLRIRPGCGMATVWLGVRDDEAPRGQQDYQTEEWPKQYHENCLTPLVSTGTWGHVNAYGN